MARRSPKKCRRYVDMWAVPGAHPSNVEFLQKLKTADTNHFTKNMNSIGTVSQLDTDTQKWEKTHLLGVRTDVWKPDESEMAHTLDVLKDKRKEEMRRDIKRTGRLNTKQADLLEEQMESDSIMQMQSEDIEKRRLVLKLFKTSSQRTRWCGTIEQVTTTEIHNSLGCKKPMLTMAVMLTQSSAVTMIQQNHRTWRVPAVFSFCYCYDDSLYHVLLRRKWFAMGADFEIIIEGKSVGLIDGRLMSFGSDSYINLSDHPLSANTQFLDLLTLFGASVGYHNAMRRSVKRRVSACLAGEGHRHVVEDEEMRLKNNGRKAA